jgi:hypothetical protein
MATGFLSPIGNNQWFNNLGVILAGGKINTYLAGTTTPAPTFTTPNLSIPNPNPIILDSAGRPPQEIWLQSGVTYKFVVTDANGNPLSVSTFDNISGVNDTGGGGGGGGGSPASEWQISSLTPTFVDATHFTVPGNQTTLFSVNRRIYATVTAGTIYGTVTASSFSSNTSVTVKWDSGALDSGLSQVAYSILNPTNPSYLSLVNIQILSSSGVLAPTNGANRAKIRAVGGGGAGGGTPTTAGSNSSAAGGGSSGGYIEAWVTTGWQGLAGTTVTIGAGGTGSVGAGGANGGDTTLGAVLTAPGGKGAVVAAAQSTSPVGPWTLPTGPRGTVSSIPSTTLTAVLEMTGGLGTYGYVATANSPIAGDGGSNPLGIGGLGNGSTTATGNNGSGYGSGGSGASSFNTSTTYAGGNGAGGVIIIEEYL